ncbi:MAG TPA: protein kinase [Terriglobales bacterium]|nr:protein kinase [Terriglobales bacterium]
MSLAPSTRLGPYEILSALGAGGMGEVYKARDTRLDRTVAIKILPEHISSMPQARERFEREARAVSSLNHPHICTLHDIGHQDGIDYLVMEYLEGETLAQRLKKGALPLDQVLRHAIEIADALDTAHRHNVIHRDLKPGNIMLTKSGAKLLDFGLAKVRAAEAVAGVSMLATETTPLTGAGTILGTLQYMAPEQLEGKDADTRTDIFALGAVIYELATGRKAFEGRSQASLISAIMTSEPQPISALQNMAPPALDHVVRTCMAKDPDARWQTAHDVLVELKWIGEAGSPVGIAASVVTKWSTRERISWGLVAGLSVALAAFAAFHFSPRSPEPHTVRLQFPLPDKVRIDYPVISPDGQRVLLPGVGSDGTRHLWLRSLDSLTYQVLPGTEEAYFPFWSPDSESVAFFTSTKLKRIKVAGGPAETICNVGSANVGGTWNREGVILFSDSYGRGMRRVSASGGESRPVIELNKSRHETAQTFPQFLPDGRHFLYLSEEGANHDLYVGSLDAKDAHVLIRGGSPATYVPPGFLVYGSQGRLFTRRFDAGNLRLTGDAVQIAENVARMTSVTGYLASVSQSGVLVYSPGVGRIQLAWHNRDGIRQAALGEPGLYEELDLSPDEKRLAVIRRNLAEDTSELWILEIPTGVFSRLSSRNTTEPHWSPDSRELVFSAHEQGKADVYRRLQVEPIKH